MQFPKLTPLQSRFAACLGTSLVLLIIYFSLNPSQFAYAAELDSILNEDHNHHRIHAQQLDLDWGGVSHQLLEDEEEEGLPAYQAAFGVGLPPNLVGRQALDTVRLKNNMPNTLNLVPGETQWYVFEASELRAAPGGRGVQLPTNVTGQDATLKRRKDKRSLELAENGEILEKRQNSSARTVYLSANTCLQPALNENKTGTPGQPTIYISRSNTNQKPDADTNDGFQQLDQGYASLALQEVEDSIFISITAPQLPNDTFTGPWSYQIAASTDDYYHYYNNETAFMWTVDTDSTSALLATYNLTDQNGNLTSVQQQRQAWMDMTNDPPFDIYVFNSSSPKIDGIKNSYCGLSKLNMDFMRINSSISERGVGKNPKQQFYMQSLVAGNTYFSVLAYKGANSSDENAATIGGGGQVWKSMQFSTKAGMSPFSLLLLTEHNTNRIRRQLPRHLRPSLLRLSRLRRPHQPLQRLPHQRLHPRLHLRRPCAIALHQLRALPPADPLQHHLHSAVLPHQHLRRLRPRLQNLALRRHDPALRRLQLSGPLSRAEEYRESLPQWHGARPPLPG